MANDNRLVVTFLVCYIDVVVDVLAVVHILDVLRLDIHPLILYLNDYCILVAELDS